MSTSTIVQMATEVEPALALVAAGREALAALLCPVDLHQQLVVLEQVALVLLVVVQVILAPVVESRSA